GRAGRPDQPGNDGDRRTGDRRHHGCPGHDAAAPGPPRREPPGVDPSAGRPRRLTRQVAAGLDAQVATARTSLPPRTAVGRPRLGTPWGMHPGHAPPPLDAYGWDPVFAERFAPFADQGLLPARIVVQYQQIYRVVTEDGELLAMVAGRLRHRAEGRVDYPAVGD